MTTHLPAIRVLIVDDQPVARAGIAAVLRSEADVEIVGEADDGIEAIATAQLLWPDVVLMDLHMPRMGGIETTRLMREIAPSAKVVMVSMYDQEEYIRSAIDSGACGYVLKESLTEQLPTAIRTVYGGKAHFTDFR